MVLANARRGAGMVFPDLDRIVPSFGLGVEDCSQPTGLEKHVNIQ